MWLMKQKTIKLLRRILKVLKPLANLTLSPWADEYRRLSQGSSAEPGRWKTSRAPYQREIMDAITDDGIKKVIVMSAAQVGKTDMCILNAIGYHMHYDPCPIIVMQPDLTMGESFSKDRLDKMIQDTPVLEGKVND